MRGLEVCRSKSCVIKSDSVDSRPYRRASRENTGLENPLTDLLSSKITDYYFLIHLSLHPPPSFPSHSFIIIRLSPPSSSSLLFRGMAARYHSFEVYFICNAKEKLIVLIFFFFFLGIVLRNFRSSLSPSKVYSQNSFLSSISIPDWKTVVKLLTLQYMKKKWEGSHEKIKIYRLFFLWSCCIDFFQIVTYVYNYDWHWQNDWTSSIFNEFKWWQRANEWISTENKNNFTLKLFY